MIAIPNPPAGFGASVILLFGYSGPILIHISIILFRKVVNLVCALIISRLGYNLSSIQSGCDRGTDLKISRNVIKFAKSIVQNYKK